MADETTDNNAHAPLPTPTVSSGAASVPKFLVDGMMLTAVRNGVVRFLAYRDDIVPEIEVGAFPLTRQYQFQMDMDVPTLVSIRVFLDHFVGSMVAQGQFDQEELNAMLAANPFENINAR